MHETCGNNSHAHQWVQIIRLGSDLLLAAIAKSHKAYCYTELNHIVIEIILPNQCMCESIVYLLDRHLIIGARASPPTSPQRDQSTDRQTDREQRVMGSPPRSRRRQPHPPRAF